MSAISAPAVTSVSTEPTTRYDWGSSMSIVFTPDARKLIVGFSKKERIYKFPCGKIELDDLGGEAQAESTPPEVFALNCARRELERETDPRVLEHLITLSQLEYIRSAWKNAPDGSRRQIRQYHFVGVLDGHVPFYDMPIEHTEMAMPEYWEVLDVLRLDRGDERKVNPFHQIALCKCLRELRKKLDGGWPEFDTLWSSLIRIPVRDREMTDLYDYEGYVRDLIDRHVI